MHLLKKNSVVVSELDLLLRILWEFENAFALAFCFDITDATSKRIYALSALPSQRLKFKMNRKVNLRYMQDKDKTFKVETRKLTLKYIN